MMTVYEKLSEVQSKLNVPKNQYNAFGKYNYRACEDILEAAKPVLKDAGAALTVGDELVMIGERYYIKATATFIDTDTGEKVENVAYAREPEEKKGMDASQVTGATSTYARKYALNGLFCLDDVKDADSMDNSVKVKKSEKLDEKYVNSLEAELKRTGVSKKSMLQNYDVTAVGDLNLEQYKDAMSVLEKKPDKAKPKKEPEPEYMSFDDSSLPWNQ